MELRTYRTMPTSADDARRAQVFWVLLMVGALVLSFMFALVWLIIESDTVLIAGLVSFAVFFAVGAWRMDTILTMAVKATTTEMQSDAQHARNIAEANAEAMKLEAQTRLVDARARLEATRTTAFTRSISLDEGRATLPTRIEPPTKTLTLPDSIVNAPPEFVVLPDGKRVKIDLLMAMAAMWPDYSRAGLRAAGWSFRDGYYTAGEALLKGAANKGDAYWRASCVRNLNFAALPPLMLEGPESAREPGGN